MIGRSGIIAAPLGFLGLLVLAGSIFGACKSEPSGPAACTAAGGRCILGPGIGCAKFGPQDCNPDRNPGGAMCCLEESLVDSGGVEAASHGDVEAAGDADIEVGSHEATDTGGDITDA